MAKQEVKAQCEACGGSGVYVGFAEPNGIGVVCLQCQGSGCQTIHYVPFTERKRRRDVDFVRRSKGSFIAAGVGPVGESVTYQEFLEGKMPR